MTKKKQAGLHLLVDLFPCPQTYVKTIRTVSDERNDANPHSVRPRYANPTIHGYIRLAMATQGAIGNKSQMEGKSPWIFF
jgi:hypothetical protein